MTFLALPILAALTLNASAVEMGILAASGTIPMLLFGLIAGVWVDRLHRQRLMIMTDIGRAIVLLAVPIAAWFNLLHMEMLYTVAFIMGILSVFFDIAYQAYLPALVQREQLTDANSKLEVSRSAAQITGPGLAGVLMQLGSAVPATIIDALSFIISAVCLSLIRIPESTPVTREQQQRFWSEISEGLKIVGTNPMLRAIAGCTGTANFFGHLLLAVLVLYMTRELGAGPTMIGVVFASGNIGFFVGALMAGRVPARLGIGRTLIGAPLLAAVGALLIPFARGSVDVAIPLLIGAQFLGTLGGTIYSITQLSLRQTITPDRLLGRMSATMRMIVLGTVPLGALLGGVLGEAIGLWSTLMIGAIGRLFPVLWIWFSPIRLLNKQETIAEELALAKGMNAS